MPDDGRQAVRSVDVRELEAPPVDSLVAALGTVDPGESIEVRTSTVPIELCDALEKRAWCYQAVRTGNEDWRIHITVEPGADHHDGEERHHRTPGEYDR